MNKFLKIDPILFITSLVLLGIGLFTLYSLTVTNSPVRADFFKNEFTNQLIFTLVGFLISAVVFAIPPIYLRFKTILIVLYMLTLLILVFTLVFGLDIRGVKRWISIGGSVLEDGTITGGITIQPSEFAKIAIIIITSAILSFTSISNKEIANKTESIISRLIVHRFLILSIVANVVLLILIFAQKSLSVTTVTLIIILSILFAYANDKRIIFLGLLCFGVSLVFSQSIFFTIPIVTKILLFVGTLVIYAISVYSDKLDDRVIFCAIAGGIIGGSIILTFTWNNVLREYQKDRIEAYINPQRNNQDEGFQQEQSKISIGAGQIFGQGFTQAGDSRVLLLPEPTTDFIFAIFSFKFGFVGATAMILTFLIMIGRIFYLADHMNDRFSSMVLIGVGTMILVQFFSNIGMNLDILPVGGTTLPFISAGGSSLISMMIAMAICQNIIATSKVEKNVYYRKDKVSIDGWNM